MNLPLSNPSEAPTLRSPRVQAYASLLGHCYYGKDINPLSRRTNNFRICFNATGVDSIEGRDVLSFGSYLGWSIKEQAFGFAGGSPCPLSASGTDLVLRAAKVRVGCCPIVAAYLMTTGKQLGLSTVVCPCACIQGGPAHCLQARLPQWQAAAGTC